MGTNVKRHTRGVNRKLPEKETKIKNRHIYTWANRLGTMGEGGGGANKKWNIRKKKSGDTKKNNNNWRTNTEKQNLI